MYSCVRAMGRARMSHLMYSCVRSAGRAALAGHSPFFEKPGWDSSSSYRRHRQGGEGWDSRAGALLLQGGHRHKCSWPICPAILASSLSLRMTPYLDGP